MGTSRREQKKGLGQGPGLRGKQKPDPKQKVEHHVLSDKIWFHSETNDLPNAKLG